MAQTVAVTRAVSAAFANCELTHLPRVAIDVDKARVQHAEYERALERAGCVVERIPEDPELADSVFVEDAAVVLDEVAIMTRPGAQSRRAETSAVEATVRRYRRIARIEPPGTIDGGDVMVVARSIFVGRSTRTNASAIEQMRGIVTPFGYHVNPVSVHGCLHLKSAVTALDDHTLVINPEWADVADFDGFEFVAVDPLEPAAANIVRANGALVYSAGYRRTLEALNQRGFRVTAVDVSEIAKAEGAVTCCSLIFTKDSHWHSPA